MRPGVYWPVAVRYTGASHLTVEALGYYDHDGDLEPDSLVLNGNVSNIDLTVFPFAPTTARNRLATARTAVNALGYDPAPRLQLIDSEFGARLDGTAYGWSYLFYSGRADTLITALVDPIGVASRRDLLPPLWNASSVLSQTSLLTQTKPSPSLSNGAGTPSSSVTPRRM